VARQRLPPLELLRNMDNVEVAVTLDLPLVLEDQRVHIQTIGTLSVCREIDYYFGRYFNIHLNIFTLKHRGKRRFRRCELASFNN
jgi:hypothetical protein